MKKLLLVSFALFSMSAFAQDIDFGLKAGMAYNTDNGVLKALDGAYQQKGKGSMGFQVGGMMRIKAIGFYVQPEVLYTSFKNEYDAGGVKKNRIDIPVNVGKTFALGLVQVQTGPVLSINLKDKIDGSEFNNVEANKTDNMSLGWQVGTGVNIKNLNFDVRYEFGLGKTSSEFIQNQTGTNFKTEDRINMLNISVGYFF